MISAVQGAALILLSPMTVMAVMMTPAIVVAAVPTIVMAVMVAMPAIAVPGLCRSHVNGER
jgi:hypothetical protein